MFPSIDFQKKVTDTSNHFDKIMNIVQKPEFVINTNLEFITKLNMLLKKDGEFTFLIETISEDSFKIIDRYRFTHSILRAVFKFKKLQKFISELSKLGYVLVQNGCADCKSCITFKKKPLYVAVNYQDLQQVLNQYQCQIQLLQSDCAYIRSLNQKLLREFRPWVFEDPFL